MPLDDLVGTRNGRGRPETMVADIGMKAGLMEWSQVVAQC